MFKHDKIIIMIYSGGAMMKIFTIYGFLIAFISIIVLYFVTEIFKSKTIVWICTVVFMIIYDFAILKFDSFVSVK